MKTNHYEKALAYKTSKSKPITLPVVSMKDAITEAEKIGALWVVAQGIVAGKTITGKWAKV